MIRTQGINYDDSDVGSVWRRCRQLLQRNFFAKPAAALNSGPCEYDRRRKPRESCPGKIQESSFMFSAGAYNNRRQTYCENQGATMGEPFR